MMGYIPLHILIEIIVRLPVKSIVRFTCVCKSWYSLITDSIFISAHLHHTTANYRTKDQNILVGLHHEVGTHCTLRFFDETTGVEFSELDFPYVEGGCCFNAIGSCNGLLCLSYDYGYKESITLWNPSIRKSTTVLSPYKERLVPSKFVLGFGVDPMTCDCKVVRIVYNDCYCTDAYHIPTEVELYSLGTGSWRSIPFVPQQLDNIDFTWSQVFLNGFVHWIAYEYPARNCIRRLIVTMDMGKDVFCEIMPPNPSTDSIVKGLEITVLGKSLSILEYSFDLTMSLDTCCIWVMKEYGVEESWTKLNSVVLNRGVDNVIGLRTNGEVVLRRWKEEIVVYDPKTGEMKDLNVSVKSSSCYVYPYSESVTLLNRGNGVC